MKRRQDSGRNKDIAATVGRAIAKSKHREQLEADASFSG